MRQCCRQRKRGRRAGAGDHDDGVERARTGSSSTMCRLQGLGVQTFSIFFAFFYFSFRSLF